MNKKTVYIIVAVLVVVIVVAAAGIFLMNNSGNSGETTPTVSVKDATSLQYSANVTNTATGTITYNFAGKNLGTSNMTIRVDLLGGELGNYSYILNAGEEKSWSNTNGGAWTAGNFTADWASWGTQWTENANELGNNWSGTGDYSYTASSGESITITCIAVNPTLADSLFQTS
jgi:hypothetical protein